MPFVPIVDFWSTETSISIADLRLAVQGRAGGSRQLILPADDAEAVAAELGVEVGPTVSLGATDDIRAAAGRGALGLLRATDVSSNVRALAIDGLSLFGNDRVSSIREWPLVVTVPSSAEWDQSGSWTLVAAGDMMLDRGVAEQTTILGKGADYLFDGGTARVTRIRCCSFYGYDYPAAEKTGNRGAVRELLSGADLAIANLESAVLVDAPYHSGGFTFTADASLLDGVANAGLDFISLANNHSRNGGSRGLLTAMRELEARGIAHAGAGEDDRAAARPAYVEVNGLTVGFVSCDAISRFSWATPDKVGTMSCRGNGVSQAVSVAAEQADVVIVFPHWGREYRVQPAGAQRAWARDWLGAGAELVIGAHSHVAGEIEHMQDGVVFYSLGNFIFDQDFSTPTMMGVVPALTFNADRLMQIELHATLIIDAQPNLVAPTDGGRIVLDQMREGPAGLVLD